MSNMKSWKNKFEEAKGSGNNSAEYLQAGDVVLRIDLVKDGENDDGIDNFKLEGTVLHKFEGPHAVGDSVCIMHSRKFKQFFGNIKQMIADIMGKPASEITFDHFCEAANSDPEDGTVNPLKGFVIRVVSSGIEGINASKNPYKFTENKVKGMLSKKELLDIIGEDNLARYESSTKFA
jgi:hypothetical protein